MIPHWWAASVLALGAFRVTRLIGWDDLPPVERLRAWLVGEHTARTGSGNSHLGLTATKAEDTTAYRRPTLNHFVHCAFCQGFWVALVVYLAWLGEARWTLLVLFPFALSSVVGLVARNLDP